MHGAGAAAMHELLVVMQIEAIEVDALQAFDLLDAKDLPGPDLERLAGSGLQHHFEQDIAIRHRAAPLRCFAACSRKRLADQRNAVWRLAAPNRPIDEFELLLVEAHNHCFSRHRPLSRSASADPMRFMSRNK